MKTILYIHHLERDIITSLKVRPRVNPFESIKQDLPTFYAITRPIELRNSGDHLLQLLQSLLSRLRLFRSARCVTPRLPIAPSRALRKTLSPFPSPSPLTITPNLGGRSHLLRHKPLPRVEMRYGLLTYGAKANLYGQRQWAATNTS